MFNIFNKIKSLIIDFKLFKKINEQEIKMQENSKIDQHVKLLLSQDWLAVGEDFNNILIKWKKDKDYVKK